VVTVSERNSDRSARASIAIGLVIAAVLMAATGCGVRAYQREALSDRVMDVDADAGEEGREMKWLEAREASTGGVGGAGGGCACN
jgi:hypothetical protein